MLNIRGSKQPPWPIVHREYIDLHMYTHDNQAQLTGILGILLCSNWFSWLSLLPHGKQNDHKLKYAKLK